MTTYVALLRGINVGGRHKVAMTDLRALFAEVGGENVATYIQSGNVVFTQCRPFGRQARRRSRPAHRGHDRVHGGRRCSHRGRVGRRGGRQPVSRPRAHPARDLPQQRAATGALDAIDAAAFRPEEFVLVGREIYLHLPNGMARTKLPQALDVFSTPVTTRNWRTVCKLAELASG